MAQKLIAPSPDIPMYIEHLANKISPSLLVNKNKEDINDLVGVELKAFFKEYIIKYYLKYKMKRAAKDSSDIVIRDLPHTNFRIQSESYRDQNIYDFVFLSKHYADYTPQEIFAREINGDIPVPIAILLGSFGFHRMRMSTLIKTPGRRWMTNSNYLLINAAPTREIAAWEMGLKKYYRFISTYELQQFDVETAINVFKQKKSYYMKRCGRQLGYTE